MRWCEAIHGIWRLRCGTGFQPVSPFYNTGYKPVPHGNILARMLTSTEPSPIAAHPDAVPSAARIPRPDAAFYVTAAAIFVIFLLPKIFQHAGAHTGDLDTGVYSNLAWALTHGEGFSGSTLGRHHLGEHFSPVMLLVAPLYLIWSSAYVLMILQAIAITLTVVLVLRFADVELRRAGVVEEQSGDAAARARFGACALLIFLFMVYPPVLATLRAQFQPIELGMPMVVAAIMLMHARRDVWLALMVFLLLCTRESAPLSVAGLGIYAALAMRRYRLAVVLLIIAGVWAGVTMGIIMPHFRTSGRWAHLRHVENGGPWKMWDLKLKYLAAVLLGLGPLPFIGRRALAATAAAVPGILLNLAVARDTQITFVGHYDAQTAPFMMIAAVHGLAILVPLMRTNARPVIAARVASTLLGLGMFFSANMRTAFQLALDYYPTPQERQFVREAHLLAKKYADAPAMSGWAFIGPQICNRPHYMAMRAGGDWPARMEWAADRLQPGTIILVPTDQFGGRAKRELQLLYFGGRATLLDRREFVEAWQWPIDAPPPRTRESREYVFSGRQQVEMEMAATAAATNPAATRPATQAAAATQPAPTPRRKRPRE